MLIPIRCFSCNKVLANKWETYKRKAQEVDDAPPEDEASFINFEKGHKGKVLDELGVTRLCCRRHMLTHVDLIDTI